MKMLHRFPFRSLLFAGAVATGTAPHGASATMIGKTPALSTYVAEADLVFHGVVENIQYARSTPRAADETEVPYTFVTYRVASPMKGADPGPTVTLRFVGGLDERDGSFLATDHTPLFDIGDEDILFVKAGDQRLTPLVREDQGRFRIVMGQVYSDAGQEVLLSRSGKLSFGQRHALEEVQTTRVGNRIMRFKTDAAPAAGAPSQAIAVGAFTDAIENETARAGKVLALPVMSADPAAVFDGPDVGLAPPPSP